MSVVTNFPSTVVDDATVGSTAWTNPGNAVASDNSYATNGGSSKHYIKATGFGFAIPTDAILTEVAVFCEAKTAFGSAGVNDLRIVLAGVITAIAPFVGALIYTTTEQNQQVGLSNQIHGLTVADVNNAGFGAAIQFTSGNLSVDAISIRVTYLVNSNIQAAAMMDLF